MRSWPCPGCAGAVTEADCGSSTRTASPVVGSVPSMLSIGTPSSVPSTLKVGPGLETTKGTGTQKRIATIARRATRAVTRRQLTSGIRSP